MKSTLFRVFAVMMVLSMVFAPFAARPALAGGPVTDAPAPASETIDASETGLYIVRLKGAAVASYKGGIPGFEATSPAATGASKLDSNSSAVQAYRAYLQAQHTEAIRSIESALGRSLDVTFQYLNVLNGFAAPMSATEAQKVAELDGIVAVYPDTLRYLDTDVGPGFIGAGSIWTGDTGSGVATQGEGVIIGVIDSGVNHLHPSFADLAGDGYDHTNPYGAGVYAGYCATDPTFCNDKLIGAYGLNPIGSSPEDADGHGSHTASTAGGNRHDVAIDDGAGGTFTVTISGVAPHANIIAYKVCAPSCPGSASVMAVDYAITDGVDVLNYSISGSDDPWNDPVDLAFLDAFDAGIFVSASAGNAGPGASTVAKTGPWNASVAASTHTRLFAVSVDITDSVDPALQDLGAIAANDIPLGGLQRDIDYYAANIYGCTAGGGFPAGYFTNKIALISRGTCTFAEKIANAMTAGALGVVMFNNRPGSPIAMGGLTGSEVPSVMVGQAAGLAIAAEIDANAPTTARINSDVQTVIDPDYGDIVGDFSSRGPSQWELLKPDYAAPGVEIFAAVAAQPGDPVQYDLLQGTSMSSPHGAGAAALMVALNPTWSPAEIKSAIASTTKPWYELRANTGAAIVGATPFDSGSGRINLSMAATAGLVMNETYANYVAADPAFGGDPKTINQPSMVNYSCVVDCEWTRTFKSVLPFPATYTVSFTSTVPMTFTASPAVFTINPGATQQVVFTAETLGLPAGTPVFGDVMLETNAVFGGGGSTTVLTQAFTDVTFPPTGWERFDVDGGTPVAEWTRSGTDHTGDLGGSAYHVYGGSTAPDQDGWLVSPAFSTTTGSLLLLNFWERGSFVTDYVGHYLHVCDASVSDCSAPPTNYMLVAETGQLPAASTWYQRSFDLSAYAGGNLRIAFQYTGYYADSWYVDDVIVTETPVGAPVAAQRLTTVVVPADAYVPPTAAATTSSRAGMTTVSMISANEITDFTYSIDGLVLAGDYMVELPQDPTNGLPYNGDGGTFTALIDVPAGALSLIAQVYTSEAPDVDMFVGTGSTPSAGTVVCTSASGIALESCTIDSPAAGTYWVLIQNYTGSDAQPDEIGLLVAAPTPGDAGNLMVDAPETVPAGQPFDVNLYWDLPEAEGNQTYVGYVTFGSSPTRAPGDLGTTFVTVSYMQPAYITKDAPAQAAPGDTIPYTIVLSGADGMPLDGMGWMTDTLPAGMEYVSGTLTASFGDAWYDAGDNAVYWSKLAGAPVLHDNGPLVTHPGAGLGGADVSRLQVTTLGMTTLGAGHNAAGGISVAEDFSVPAGGWDIDSFVFYAYQTGSTTASTINGLYYVIYDGDPTLTTTQVIYDMSITNTLMATGWSGIYRDSETSVGNTQRPIMASAADAGIFLPEGDYWLEWAATGSLASGPWAPPITIISETITGNAKQYLGGWTDLLDGGSLTPQGLPFLVVGATPSVITITFDVMVTAEPGAVVTNTAELYYEGDVFSAEAVTELPYEVTFMYHDLEGVVGETESVHVAGSFNEWTPGAFELMPNADRSVFTGTALIFAGSYEYKYVMNGSWDNGNGAFLNTNNRALTVAGEMEVDGYRNVVPGYVHLAGPDMAEISLGESVVITGETWYDGVTAGEGGGKGLVAVVGYGTGSDLSTWTWTPMEYLGENGNNDLWQGEIMPMASGIYSYAVAFDGNSHEMNPNSAWHYGDLDGVYPGNGFSLAQTGVVEVAGYAMLRVAHLAPFAADPMTAVTVTVNGMPILTGFEYGDSTPYIALPAGVYDVAIYAADPMEPVLSGMITLTEGMDYSAVAVGGANNAPLDLMVMMDDNTVPMTGTFKLQLGHLAPFAETITGTLADIRADDGTAVLTNVPYGVVAPALPLPVGAYDLKITAPGGTPTYFNLPPLTFVGGEVVAAFATGDGVNQPIGVFVWASDGIGYFLDEEIFILYMPLILR